MRRTAPGSVTSVRRCRAYSYFTRYREDGRSAYSLPSTLWIVARCSQHSAWMCAYTNHVFVCLNSSASVLCAVHSGCYPRTFEPPSREAHTSSKLPTTLPFSTNSTSDRCAALRAMTRKIQNIGTSDSVVAATSNRSIKQST